MDNLKRLKEIEIEEEKWKKSLDEKDRKWDYEKPFQAYSEHVKPERMALSKLDREKRMLITPEFSDLSDFDDVMSLESFIENVNDGGFTNYDGYGCYVKDGKRSDIEIFPSDVKYDSIRKDFDTIVWFNN